MAALKSRTQKRKKLYKLRKNRSWISIIVFLLLTLVAVVMCTVILEIFTLYIVKTDIGADLQIARNSVDIYEEKKKNGSADPWKAFDEMGLSYRLVDDNDNVIREKGEITIGDGSAEFDNLVSVNDLFYGNDPDADELKENIGEDDEEGIRVVAYPDSEIKVLKISDGSVSFYINQFGKYVFNLLDDEEDSDSKDVFMELPIWLSIDVDGGTQHLIFKASADFNFNDIALIISILAALLVLVVVIFIFLLGTVISGIRGQRRVRKVLFADISTNGHNHMWFMFKGEHILTRRRNAKYNFAVVDLVLVKYRRFCACHSIDEGDRVVFAVNNIIKSRLQRKEIVAHSSEDSFTLLLRYEDAGELRERISALVAQLSTATAPNNFAYHAGVQLIPKLEGGLFKKRKDLDLERDFNYACTACATLDETDESGIVFFEGSLVEEQRWIDTVTASQQTALANQEFVVYYQPKYDPRTNELRGAEALIRWQSPTFGFVTPYKFIPIFEKNGFITEIDHYMISHVARDQRRWLDMGYRCVPVSVNVSRAHFIESDLAEQIRDMVDKEGTPHELIEIELTESAFFDDKNAMINTISKLKSYGFTVSMDDFGSGYSSLNSLKDMPLDVLKLDAEFFRGESAGTDRGEIVVSEAIKLAKNLNMRTVAEGVEIRDQVEFLASQGCDMIQGYYFAKPMPGNEYEERMKNVTAPESDMKQGSVQSPS